MEFGSEWAYLKAGEEIESVSEEESSSEEDIPPPSAPSRVRMMQVPSGRRMQGGAGATAAPAIKAKKKKWRLQPTGEDDGKVTIGFANVLMYLSTEFFF